MNHGNDDKEALDLVNGNDQVIGSVVRGDFAENWRLSPGYIRATELFLVNKAGEIFVPKRAAHKKIAPGGFDYSCGGHVSSGESYQDALVREVYEELGIHIQPDMLHFVMKFGPEKNDPYFRAVFTYPYEETPSINADDFSAGSWMTPEALVRAISEGHPSKLSMLHTVKAVFKVS